MSPSNILTVQLNEKNDPKQILAQLFTEMESYLMHLLITVLLLLRKKFHQLKKTGYVSLRAGKDTEEAIICNLIT